MSALVALLGGVRGTLFATLAVALLAYAVVQSVRLRHAQDEIRVLAAQLSEASTRIAGCAQAMQVVNAQADEEIAKAHEQARAGEAAVEHLQAQTVQLAGRLDKAQTDLDAAKSDPTCAEQLRMKLCSAIPLL